MTRPLFTALLVASLAGALVLPTAMRACPFCGGVQLTLADEIKRSELVILAQVVQKEMCKDDKAAPDPNEVPKTRFKIVDVLKGKETLGDAAEIEVLYFGQEPPERTFLIQAASMTELNWGTPLPLSDRAVAYVRQLPGLPDKGADRLAFFQDYFEDADDLLARDSYDEFAKAPYGEVKELKERMQHDKYVAWIKDANTLTSRRRLYLTLLGVCSTEEQRAADVALLEEILKAEGDEPKPALDAAIACYLTLKGPDGLPLIEERFLKNKECSYSDTYAAIMALRFQGQEEQNIPRERLLAGLRNLLDRPELADLVIPDLARWQDWSAIDRLVKLFKDADEKSSWVRVPVIQYLRACPKPEAKKYVDELAKIDPEAVKRANFFVPLGGGKPAPAPAPAKDVKDGKSGAEAAPAGTKPAKSGKTQKKTSAVRTGNPFQFASAALPAPDASASAKSAEVRVQAAPRRVEKGSWAVVAVPASAGLGLLGVLALVVRPVRRGTRGE